MSISGNPTRNATLGLVASASVRVMHPATTAINAPQHSVTVDNYATGANSPQPYLMVHGALAQRYRGAVGWSAAPATSRTTTTTIDCT